MSDLTGILNFIIGSPQISGLLLAAVGKAYLKFASHLNEKGLAPDISHWVHLVYVVLAVLVGLLKDLDTRTLPTDPSSVQAMINFYANTYVFHFLHDKFSEKLPLQKDGK